MKQIQRRYYHEKISNNRVSSVISYGALSGCSLLEKENGIIAYGSEQQVNTVIDKYNNDIKEKNTYKMKRTILEDKKVLVMDKKTGKELVKKGLLKKVDKDDDTEAVDKLPVVSSNHGVLFAKEKVENVTIDGEKLKYEGNTIIANGRAYADIFAIVDDAVYGNVKGEEKSVGVLKYDKNPKKALTIED